MTTETRTIESAATFDDLCLLKEQIANAMGMSMEVGDVADFIDNVMQVESDRGCQFTNKQIVMLWRECGDQLVDGWIENHCQNSDACGVHSDEETIAAYERQRPSSRRYNDLMKAFSGDSQ